MHSAKSMDPLELILTLNLEYVDTQNEILIKNRAVFPWRTTISDVTKKFLEISKLNFIYSGNLHLVSIHLNERHYSVPFPNAHTTLYELNVESESTLRFKPELAESGEGSLHTMIWGPGKNEKIYYSWNERTTTLGMLLNDVIKIFRLELVEPQRIRLVTISDAQIDLLANSHVRLSSLGLKNKSTIWIILIDLPRHENVCVHTKCISYDQTLLLYVSPTNTIAELNKKIENCLVIIHELYTETNKKLNLNDRFRTLNELGVQSDQIIYAKPRLSINPVYLSAVHQPSNEVQPSASAVSSQQKVIIRWKLSPSKTVHIIASVKDTVAELTKKIASYKKDQQLAQFQLRSGTIVIDDTQPTRCLADFGIKSGSTIEAKMIEFNPSSNSDKSKPVISSSILPIGLKNRKNSCFMNSALQCLLRVMPLTQYFLESFGRTQRNADKPSDSYGKVTGAYADLLWNFQRTDYANNAFTPSRLRTAINCLYPSFATADEQDAQEFLTSLLNTIHEELQAHDQYNQKTIIEKLFVGKIKSLTTCLRCNHVKTKIEKLSLVSLPLSRQQREFTIEFHSRNGRQAQSKVVVFASGRIEHLVKAFVDQRHRSDLFDRILVQATETDEPFDFSSPLYMLTDSTVRLIEQKKRFIRNQPIKLDIDPNKITLYECLREFISIEYLNDPWFCEETGCNKNSKAIRQLQICTLPPVLIIQLKRFAFENGRQKEITTLVEYPIDGLDLRDSSTSQHATYDLIAVSYHRGSMRSGHFTACARQGISTDQWYKFDDAKVSTISSISEIVTADAYLLFYMKRNYRFRY